MTALALTDAERATLLKPCACGHTINDHGSWCWACTEDGPTDDECQVTFEELLCERVAVIVDRRVGDGVKRVRGPVIDLDGFDPYTEGVRDSLAVLPGTTP